MQSTASVKSRALWEQHRNIEELEKQIFGPSSADLETKIFGGSSHSRSDVDPKGRGGSSHCQSDLEEKIFGGSSHSQSDLENKIFGGSSHSRSDQENKIFDSSSHSNASQASKSSVTQKPQEFDISFSPSLNKDLTQSTIAEEDDSDEEDESEKTSDSKRIQETKSQRSQRKEAVTKPEANNERKDAKSPKAPPRKNVEHELPKRSDHKPERPSLVDRTMSIMRELNDSGHATSFLDELSANRRDAPSNQQDVSSSHREEESTIVECTRKSRTFEELMMNTILKKSKMKNPPYFEKIHNDYTASLRDQHGISDMSAHFRASGYIFSQFTAVMEKIKNETKTGFRDRMFMIRIIYRDMENYILPRLSDQYQDLTKISPGLASKVISWHFNYIKAIKNLCPELIPISTWRTDMNKLFEHYVSVGVRKKMKYYCSKTTGMDFRSKDQESDLKIGKHGEMSSSWPEEIMQYLQTELSVARKGFPVAYLAEVLELCLEELSTLVLNKVISLGKGWRFITVKRFCAVINDSSRFADQIKKFILDLFSEESGIVLESTEEEMQFDALREKANTLSKEFQAMSFQATNYMCKQMIDSLQQPECILNSIGSPSWESGDANNSVQRAIGTFHYNFADVKEWLVKDEVFHVVLKDCYDLTLQTYVESFYSNTMNAGLKDAAIASNNLRDDYMALAAFFNGPLFKEAFESNESSVGLCEQEVNSRLLIILSMSRMLDPNLISADLQQDARTILERVSSSYDDLNTPAILHLVGLRNKLTEEDSLQWLSTLAEVEKGMKEAQMVHDGKQSIRLPDLRNSYYIHRVRVSKTTFQERMPANQRMHARATSVRLLSPSVQSQAKMFVARKQQSVMNMRSTVQDGGIQASARGLLARGGQSVRSLWSKEPVNPQNSENLHVPENKENLTKRTSSRFLSM